MPDEAVPVTIVTGFLGAGKTTLLNHWLADFARGEVAVVVNEFGEVGIDGALLAQRARVVTELTGGCVCCATFEDLVRALGEIVSTEVPPKRIVIETSGAASPAGVVRAIARNPRRERMRLDGIVTVVNPLRLDAVATNDLAREQISYADVLVVSRGDRTDANGLSTALDTLGRWNQIAVVVQASRGRVSDDAVSTLEALLASRTPRFELRSLRGVDRAPSHGGLESVSLALDGDVDEERFGDWMESQLGGIEGRLVRVKGIVAVSGIDEPMIVQGVADEIEVTFANSWNGQPRSTRFVVIGFGLDAAALRATFANCVVRE